VWHSVEDLFQIIACFYTVEQCSALNNLSTASALQLSKSGLCNSKICVTFGNMQKVILSYLNAFATIYAFQSHNVWLWLHYCKFCKRLFLNQQGRHWQGRNEVRWRPGQEASLAPPCSNLRSFGSKSTVLKKVLATMLGLFGAPRSDSTPHSDKELCPPPPFVPPLGTEPSSESCNHICQIFQQLWFAR